MGSLPVEADAGQPEMAPSVRQGSTWSVSWSLSRSIQLDCTYYDWPLAIVRKVALGSIVAVVSLVAIVSLVAK